jgi:hypothetical protein
MPKMVFVARTSTRKCFVVHECRTAVCAAAFRSNQRGR